MEKDQNEILNDEKVQQVKDDVTAKIADAASEIKEEIAEADRQAAEAAGTEKLEDSFKEITDDVNAIAPEKKPAKSVNISVGALVGIIAGCVVVAALVVFLIMNYAGSQPKYGKAEGKTVATVNGEKITDADMGYYIYAEAVNQYYNVAGEDADGDLTDFDWDQDVDGKKLSDIIKENAYKNAVAGTVTAQKADEVLTGDDAWTENDEQQIQSTVDGYVQQFGEDGFNLRAKSMGISSVNEYARMYTLTIKSQTVQSVVEEDIEANMPEGVDLSEYTQDDRGSVKHVLIKSAEESIDPSTTPDPSAYDAATAFATAQLVAEQAKSGVDFDELMTQYNQDTGETSAGYTFQKGEMVEEFEAAAFALKLDEVSDPVKSDYGYHVIKRIAGFYEIQNYWVSQAKINENKKNLENISVKGIMDGVQQSGEALQAEQAEQAASAE